MKKISWGQIFAGLTTLICAIGMIPVQVVRAGGAPLGARTTYTISSSVPNQLYTSVVPKGSRVTLTAHAYDNSDNPVVISETTPVTWRYCTAGCNSYATKVMSSLAATDGPNLILDNVTSSVLIEAEVSGYPSSGFDPLFVMDQVEVKMGIDWSTIMVNPTTPLLDGNGQPVLAIDASTSATDAPYRSDMYAPLFYTLEGTKKVYHIDTSNVRTEVVASTSGSTMGRIVATAGEQYVAVFTPTPGTGTGTAIESTVITAGVASHPSTAPLPVVVVKPTVVNASTTTTPSTSTHVDLGSGKQVIDIENAQGSESLQNVTSVAPGSMEAPSGVTLQEGVSFDVTNVSVGGEVSVKIALANNHSDISVLRLYKSKNGAISDITSQATFTNIAGKTYISYILEDGGALDEDGVANGTITDPVYVGVAATLASTGNNVSTMAIVAGLICVSAIGIAAILRLSRV